MSLVDSQALGLLRTGVLEAVTFVGGRVPEDGVVDWGDTEILHDALDPCWDSVDAFSVGEYECDLVDGVNRRARNTSGVEILNERTLILLWWGMAGTPALDGTVTSQIPNSFLVMGLALTSQLSASLSKAIQVRGGSARNVLKSPTSEASLALGAHSL